VSEEVNAAAQGDQRYRDQFLRPPRLPGLISVLRH
jgi:hypothetical protein